MKIRHPWGLAGNLLALVACVLLSALVWHAPLRDMPGADRATFVLAYGAFAFLVLSAGAYLAYGLVEEGVSRTSRAGRKTA